MSDFDAVFERVPWLRSAGTPERLAGLTNLNYRIGEYVLRISGAGTSEYISRSAEEVAQWKERDPLIRQASHRSPAKSRRGRRVEWRAGRRNLRAGAHRRRLPLGSAHA
jgi:hypothetical protein